MKSIISFLIGLAVFIFSLGAANKFIHWITSSIQNHDLQIVVVIILWTLCFSVVVTISLLLGYIIGSIVKILIGDDK